MAELMQQEITITSEVDCKALRNCVGPCVRWCAPPLQCASAYSCFHLISVVRNNNTNLVREKRGLATKSIIW
jgi:hypothetical protein